MEQVINRSYAQDATDFVARSIALMRSEGFKITPQRTAILELFHQKEDHLTPQEIYHCLEGHVASLSLATVYNTLEVFEKVGIITRFCTDQGQTYYDPNPTPHHHAACESCGALFDLEIDEATMERLMVLLQGEGLAVGRFRIRETKMWFRGVCARCQ